MSGSESEDIRFDNDSGSDGYSNSPKIKKAAPGKKPAITTGAGKVAKVSSFTFRPSKG